MGTAILSHLTKPSHYQQWPQLFQELIIGYHQEEPLTEEERQVIFPMLCSIQMIAIAYFSHVNEWQDLARVNRENLVYLYAIQDELDIRLQTM